MPCYKPINLIRKLRHIVVPCGRCMGCRLKRSHDWAIRCENESKMHEHNQFLTLTYENSHLVYSTKTRMPNLNPIQLQLFVKRLRKHYGNGIRFFACGEYGSETLRPHYHACFFGLDIKDKVYRKTKNGNRLYGSDTLNRIWGHGDVVIGDVTFESASYVARYICDKKLGKDAQQYEEKNMEPEFGRMSRRPGIGIPWLERYSGDVFNHGYQVIRGGIKSAPPRLYKRKFTENEPEIMEARALENMEANFDNQEIHNRQRLRIRGIVKKAQLRDLTKDQV